jgi:hypothetical protein
MQGSQIIGDIISEWTPFNIEEDHRNFLVERGTVVNPKIIFGAQAQPINIDNSNFVINGDALYNGFYRGNIIDRGHSLEVSLVGSVLQYEGRMEGLRSFLVRPGASLQITRAIADGDAIPAPVYIQAQRIEFEAGSSIDVNYASNYCPINTLSVLSLESPDIRGERGIERYIDYPRVRVGLEIADRIPNLRWVNDGGRQRLELAFLPAPVGHVQ